MPSSDDVASPIARGGGLWRRHPWIVWPLVAAALIVLVLGANEIYQARESAAASRRANAVIDSIEAPRWMVEVNRTEVGFDCHLWSTCQERFLTVVCRIDLGKATDSERERPCDSLLVALHDWQPNTSGEWCSIHSDMNKQQMSADLYRTQSNEPLAREAPLEETAYVRIAIYV